MILLAPIAQKMNNEEKFLGRRMTRQEQEQFHNNYVAIHVDLKTQQDIYIISKLL